MSSTIINPKPCSYNCGIRIYWNNQENAYFEVFTKQRHSCPNRTTKNNDSKLSTSIPKPNYYNKFSKQPKPKMSNSLELLQGQIQDIQRKYEVLSDIVSEYNGKVHGSQSHVNGSSISLFIYYEVPDGMRDEVKRKFNDFVLSIITPTN
jgi:hypothetical protein